MLPCARSLLCASSLSSFIYLNFAINPENQVTKSATECVAMQTNQFWYVFDINSSAIHVKFAFTATADLF